jgi:hypothetical protein
MALWLYAENAFLCILSSTLPGLRICILADDLNAKFAKKDNAKFH